MATANIWVVSVLTSYDGDYDILGVFDSEEQARRSTEAWAEDREDVWIPGRHMTPKMCRVDRLVLNERNFLWGEELRRWREQQEVEALVRARKREAPAVEAARRAFELERTYPVEHARLVRALLHPVSESADDELRFVLETGASPDDPAVRTLAHDAATCLLRERDGHWQQKLGPLRRRAASTLAAARHAVRNWHDVAGLFETAGVM